VTKITAVSQAASRSPEMSVTGTILLWWEIQKILQWIQIVLVRRKQLIKVWKTYKWSVCKWMLYTIISFYQRNSCNNQACKKQISAMLSSADKSEEGGSWRWLSFTWNINKNYWSVGYTSYLLSKGWIFWC
jgi:hypothetical protein